VRSRLRDEAKERRRGVYEIKGRHHRLDANLFFKLLEALEKLGHLVAEAHTSRRPRHTGQAGSTDCVHEDVPGGRNLSKPDPEVDDGEQDLHDDVDYEAWQLCGKVFVQNRDDLFEQDHHSERKTGNGDPGVLKKAVALQRLEV
jgi:hypothetical protein